MAWGSRLDNIFMFMCWRFTSRTVVDSCWYLHSCVEDSRTVLCKVFEMERVWLWGFFHTVPVAVMTDDLILALPWLSCSSTSNLTIKITVVWHIKRQGLGVYRHQQGTRVAMINLIFLIYLFVRRHEVHSMNTHCRTQADKIRQNRT